MKFRHLFYPAAYIAHGQCRDILAAEIGKCRRRKAIDAGKIQTLDLLQYILRVVGGDDQVVIGFIQEYAADEGQKKT